MQNASNDNVLWWTRFHFEYGLDSREEAAFLGYLTTRSIYMAALDGEQLETHWQAFLSWWQTSLAT